MSTPEECEGAKPKVSLSDRGLVRTSCSHDVGPHMEADDGHATHWVWHFCMQVHCKPRWNVQKHSSLARVGARDIWRPTTVTQPIEFGTFACKCTATLAEKSRSNAASPGLVPETSCRPSAGVTHCKPVVAGVLHTLQARAAGRSHCAGIGCGWHTDCRQRLRVSHTEQSLLAGAEVRAIATGAAHCAGPAAGDARVADMGCGWRTRLRAAHTGQP